MAPVYNVFVSINLLCATLSSAEGSVRTRIMGHLDLAEVYANEFWSEVTDGAMVKHSDQRHDSSHRHLGHSSLAEWQMTPQ